MDLNAFIRTADPRKVRIVERARAENERPIVTVTLLPTYVVRSSEELSASMEREFVGDASVGDGGDQGFDFIAGQDNIEPTMPVTKPVEAEIPRPKRLKKKRVTYDNKGLPVASHPPKRLRGFDFVAGQDNIEPTVPVTKPVEAEIPRPKRLKKKRVTYDNEGLPVASHPPKRLRVDYGTTGGSATGGKSPSVLNRLLQDSRLTVEQGVLALPTLPFITSSVTASPLEEGEDRTDSVTGPSLRTIVSVTLYHFTSIRLTRKLGRM
ncbi:hypothetical protein Tco_0042927, partial [Tanacetum coccineum]